VDQSRAKCVFFETLSARRTVDLKTLRVSLDVNQGFDLEVRFESLVITGACLSSSEETVTLYKTMREPRDVGRFVMRRYDCRSETKESISME